MKSDAARPAPLHVTGPRWRDPNELHLDRRAAVLEDIAAAVVVVSGDGSVRANLRAEELFGRSLVAAEGDVLAAQLLDRNGRSVPAARQPWARAFSGERLLSEEYDLVRPDGRKLPVLCSASLARLNDEAVCTFEDASGYRARETRALDWIATVGHDLGQPASIVQLYASQLPEGRAKTEIVAATRRLVRMIESLTQVMAADGGCLSVRLERVDLDALVDGVVARWNDAGGRARVVRHGVAPMVLADPARVEQVLENLLVNARKYGDADAAIVVELEASIPRMAIAVTNHGPGISADELPFVFDRYRRARGARGKDGLGLGLYIARALVEAQGGRLRAESTPGATTTFRFDLRCAEPCV